MPHPPPPPAASLLALAATLRVSPLVFPAGSSLLRLTATSRRPRITSRSKQFFKEIRSGIYRGEGGEGGGRAIYRANYLRRVPAPSFLPRFCHLVSSPSRIPPPLFARPFFPFILFFFPFFSPISFLWRGYCFAFNWLKRKTRTLAGESLCYFDDGKKRERERERERGGKRGRNSRSRFAGGSTSAEPPRGRKPLIRGRTRPPNISRNCPA